MSRILASELLKIRAARQLNGLLIAVVLLVAAFAFANHGIASSAQGRRSLLLFGERGDAIAFIGGVIGVSAEYRDGILSRTLLTTPSRTRVFAAKILVHGAVLGLILGVGAALSALALTILLVPGHQVLVLPAQEVAQILGGTVGDFMLFGAMGVGFGTFVRNQTVAVAIAIVWFYLAEYLLTVAAPSLGIYLPGVAANAVVGVQPQLEDGNLAVRAGIVLIVYTAGLTIAGLSFFRNRDILT